MVFILQLEHPMSTAQRADGISDRFRRMTQWQGVAVPEICGAERRFEVFQSAGAGMMEEIPTYIVVRGIIVQAWE